MRIGSLSNVTLLKWQPTDTRDVFIKTVVGSMSPYSFDLNSSLRTLLVDGLVYDTSNANLSADMEYIDSLFRTGQLVWLDATDQFPSMCAFGKVAKLTGPTLDVSQGQYAAKYTIEFWPVLPWGTTMFNTWKQTGFRMRDLDGTGSEYMLDPTQMNCNFTINSTTPPYVSWEFILDNQNYLSGNQSLINTCDVTTGFSGIDGTGFAISNDTIILKQGTGSLKCSGTSNSGGWFSVQYYPVSGLQNWDFLVCWVRGDFGGNSSGQLYVLLGCGGYATAFQYYQTSIPANRWFRLVIPLRNLGIYGGSPTLSTVDRLLFKTGGIVSSSTNIWVDDINLDYGIWTTLEFMVPDNILLNSNPSGAIAVVSWNGSSYYGGGSEGAQGEGAGEGYYYALDGEAYNPNFYSNDQYGFYRPGTIGSTQPATISYANLQNNSVTYTAVYGSNNRFAFALKMPPATSDSSSGNLPSNDLSGFQAINKIRFKVTVYYGNEDTTYASGAFNSL